MEENQISLKVLGNCATQTRDHETTSFLVSTKTEKILIDCGPGIIKQLLNSGERVTDISAIIITHCHADHTASYPYLLFSINLARSVAQDRRFEKIPVIALTSVHEGLSSTLKTQYPLEGLEEKLVSKHIFTGNESFKIGDVIIKPFDSFHLVPSIGLVIEYAGKRVSITSDTLYNEELPQRVFCSDLLVHEAFCIEKMTGIAKASGHATAKEAGMTAKLAKAKKLLLAHPLSIMLRNPDVLISEAAELYKGDIILPKEMDVFTV